MKLKNPFSKIISKHRQRRCQSGKHDCFRAERFGKSWCITNYYNVCKHCDFEEYVGFKVNYD